MNATRASTTVSNVSTPGTSLVEVEKLHVRFGKQEVLRSISLSIPKGQTLVIIGESGCGKTVLLKSIIGLVQPTDGIVRFAGRSLASMGERELSEVRTQFGFVFQGAALFDSMTIAENIAFPLREHTHKSPLEIQLAIDLLLSEVGLSKATAFKKPAELSGGMRKRVGLARALALSPQIMLYDEPTTGLDPIMTDIINELIVRVRKRMPVTGIVVTHDMTTARKVGDRIVMLYPLSRLKPNESQIVFDGTPAELDRSSDHRVKQFVDGKAGTRLMELRDEQAEHPSGEQRSSELTHARQ